ncbi:hypothetical protein [Streptococcus sp. S784/96/1]|uniref:hypothetical protein n=1 Tax=Streptococcus sp. S784/96/1 TaxID=2653499 RepID=UPI0013872050|nr:hypothetical protein [Streptococcus sp. S784/96/1]
MSIIFITIVASVVFISVFVWGYFEDLKHRYSKMLIIHSEILSVELLLNKEFKKKYPSFYPILKSFDGVDLEKILDIPGHFEVLPENRTKSIKREFNKIIQNGTQNDKLLLNWYLTTCEMVEMGNVSRARKVVSGDISQDILEKNQYTRDISRRDIDKLGNGLKYAY